MTDFLRKPYTLILFSFLLAVSSYGQIYVDANAPSGGDGLSWATAYYNLQSALLIAGDGDEIWVREGTYTIIGNEDASFEIPSGVAVYGGFIGTETNRNARDWEANITTLDGQNTANSIVYFENSSSSTLLDGFLIKDGDADGTGQRGESGAGIYMDIVNPGNICDPQIKNCTIKDNTSVKGGAGIYIDGSWIGIAAPTFENCTFDNNSADADGGAIYQNGIWGGAVNAIYTNCTFKNNQSTGSGAGLFSHGGHGDVSSTFTKCNFESNAAAGNGGAMYSLGTSGGKANHTIINCRFYKNTGFAAGGIYNNGGNSNGDASPEIINCTFYANEAVGNGGTGGAIYNNGSNGGQSNTTITNCIIWDNIAPYGTHVIKNVECTPTISYCLTDADDCNELNNGTGSNINCGPGLIYEAGNDPGFVDAVNGDLRITDLSNAKDVGDNSSNNELDDLDESARKIGVIDMGAYENSNLSLPIELFSFDARPNKGIVELEWATLSEIENEAFIIEKSEDGRSFEEIGYVAGAGNSNTFLSYKAKDNSPFKGNNYYRLKIISFEGEIEYSRIEIVHFSAKEVSIYPNPVKDQIHIIFNESTTIDAAFEIYSIYGQLLSKGNLSVNNSSTDIDISSLNLANGNYILNIKLSNNQYIHKKFQKITY